MKIITKRKAKLTEHAVGHNSLVLKATFRRRKPEEG